MNLKEEFLQDEDCCSDRSYCDETDHSGKKCKYYSVCFPEPSERQYRKLMAIGIGCAFYLLFLILLLFLIGAFKTP